MTSHNVPTLKFPNGTVLLGGFGSPVALIPKTTVQMQRYFDINTSGQITLKRRVTITRAYMASNMQAFGEKGISAFSVDHVQEREFPFLATPEYIKLTKTRDDADAIAGRMEKVIRYLSEVNQFSIVMPGEAPDAKAARETRLQQSTADLKKRLEYLQLEVANVWDKFEGETVTVKDDADIGATLVEMEAQWPVEIDAASDAAINDMVHGNGASALARAA